jgi:tetratricopeptide (TPR) repeat protein
MQGKWHAYKTAAEKAQQAGNYCNAEAMWLLALEEAKKLSEKDSVYTLTLASLVEVYWNQAKYRQAEPFAKQLFYVLESVHGPDHLKVGIAAGDLAMLYHWQGKYGQAEPLYRRALSIKKRIFGENHPEVIELVENYASLMQATDRTEQAQHLNISIQQFRSPENTVRSERLRTFSDGNVSARQDAERRLSQQAITVAGDVIVEKDVKELSIEDQEQVLDSQRRWDACKSAADQAVEGQDLAGAEQIWCRALVEAERLGPRDWRLPYNLDTLAEIWSKQDKYHVAEPLLKRSLRLKIDTLGPINQTVAGALNQLAKLHYLQGHYAECELFAKKSLQVFEKVVGLEHEDVATACHNLATLHHVQGRYDEAEPYYLRSIQLRRKILGDSHPETIKSLRNYASLLLLMHREHEAERLHDQAIGLISGNWKVVQLDEDQLLDDKFRE